MARISDGADLLKCSFCGEESEAGQETHRRSGVYICDECIELYNEIIEEEFNESTDFSFDELPKPREIYEFLSRYVIGQRPRRRR